MESLPAYLSGFLAILLLSSFVKVMTTLAILKHGLGLSGGTGLVFVALALVLSALIVEPQLKRLGGLDGLIESETRGNLELQETFSPFLERHAHADVLQRLEAVQQRVNQRDKAGTESASTEAGKGTRSFTFLASGFLISELREAFQLGLVILIPFVVIDLLVLNVLMALSVTQISQQVVALPLKILLFVAVDGWSLIAEKIIAAYA